MKPLWTGNPVSAPLPPERAGFRRPRGVSRRLGRRVIDLVRTRPRPAVGEVREGMRVEAGLRRSGTRWALLALAWIGIAALFLAIPITRSSVPHFVLLVTAVCSWFALFSPRRGIRIAMSVFVLAAVVALLLLA